MQFRLYVLDEKGHITSARALTAESEEQARQHAQAAPERAAELWRGANRIGVFGSSTVGHLSTGFSPPAGFPSASSRSLKHQ